MRKQKSAKEIKREGKEERKKNEIQKTGKENLRLFGRPS
jgi:hypothetical protein